MEILMSIPRRCHYEGVKKLGEDGGGGDVCVIIYSLLLLFVIQIMQSLVK